MFKAIALCRQTGAIVLKFTFFLIVTQFNFLSVYRDTYFVSCKALDIYLISNSSRER